MYRYPTPLRMSDSSSRSSVSPAADFSPPPLSLPLLDPLIAESSFSVLLVKRGFPATVVYANTPACALFGRSDLGHSALTFPALCEQYLHPSDRAQVREAVDVGIARSLSVRLLSAEGNGTKVPLEVVPLPDAHGLVSHTVVVVGKSLTAPSSRIVSSVQPAHPPALCDSNHRGPATPLSAVYEAMPIGIGLLDSTGRIILANPAFARCLNRPITAFQAFPALAAISPELDHAVHSPTADLNPIAVPEGSGPATLIYLTVTPLTVDFGAARLITVHDVRAREAERARREEERRLESLGIFASGIAHDFNNLLTIILGYGGLIREQADSPEGINRATQAILDAGRRGADLVRQLQLFSHQHPPDCHPTDIHALIDQAIGDTVCSIPSGPAITREFTSESHVVEIDADQVLLGLRQLFLHGQNATEDAGTLTIHTRLVDEPASPTTHLRTTLVLSVCHGGADLDEVARSRLFDPFSAPQSQAGSRGIGLAVLYGILRSHEGRVEAALEPGRGTWIELHFPCHRTSAAPTPQAPEPRSIPAVAGTVLIVEDEIDIGHLWEGLFTAHGIPYRWAHDGAEAVALFRRNPEEIALLFTDVGLPGMSGWEVARALREINPSLPVLITSGAFHPNDREASGLAEPVVCLSKPFFPSSVLEHLQRLIAASGTPSRRAPP